MKLKPVSLTLFALGLAIGAAAAIDHTRADQLAHRDAHEELIAGYRKVDERTCLCHSAFKVSEPLGGRRKALRSHPYDQQECRKSHCEHYERPEMMIVRLPAQWAFFFHGLLRLPQLLKKARGDLKAKSKSS